MMAPPTRAAAMVWALAQAAGGFRMSVRQREMSTKQCDKEASHGRDADQVRGMEGASDAVEVPALEFAAVEQRLCIQGRASEWNDTYSRMTGERLPEKASQEITGLLAERWKLKRKLADKKATLGSFRYGLAIAAGGFYTTDVAKWRNRRIQIDKEIRKGYHFKYEKSKEMCKRGWTADVRRCVLAAAAARHQDGFREKVMDRLDYEEWGYYRLNKAQRRRDGELKKEIRAAMFDPAGERERCIKEERTKHDALKDQLFQQLNVSYKDVNGTCKENQGEFCPEGTSPVEKRRVTWSKGAKYGAVAYFAGKGLSIVVGGIIGAITHGVGGMLAYAFVANTLPIDWAASAAATFYGAIGPEQCSCFPNECRYDSSMGRCATEPGESMDPSRNPIGKALPQQSLKCALVPGAAETTCALQTCNASDFQGELRVLLEPWDGPPSGNASLDAARGLFGTVGRRGKEVLNCASADGSVTGALAVATALPDGRGNTAPVREELLLAAARARAAAPA